MAIRLHLCLLFLALAFGFAVAPPAIAGTAANVPGTTLDRGVVREEFSVPTRSPSGALRARRPHRVPPPLEEVVVFQDSLNALTISNQGAWTHFDNSAKPTAWNISPFLGCQGNAWWCGRIDSSWIYDANRGGYENSWTQYLQHGVWLDSLPNNQQAKIGFRHRFNAEPGYDFGTIEVLDPDDGWTALATFTGKVPNNGCDTVTVTIPDSILVAFYSGADPSTHARLPFRFAFKSDIAYSSADGLYDGDGWVVDNITVRAGNQIRFFDNMENGPGQWFPSVFPPVGDYFAISSNVFSEDICTTNRTNVWSDWDPVVFSVVPRLDNLLHTPAVAVNQASEVFVAFDVYRNLPLDACFYYHLRYRTRNAGEPWGNWLDPTRLIYYGGSKDWARQKINLPGASNRDSVQVEIALTDYSAIYCDGVSSPGGVYTYFDNVAIGVISTAPPVFIQRDVDLFNDTFQTTPFFKDDNFNTPLGDSAVVEVNASRGYQSGFMRYRFNGGPWNSTPLLPAATALPRLRYADVPIGSYPANTKLEYYFEATDQQNATAYLPAGAITDGHYFTAAILPLKTATNPSLSCFDSLATILVVNNFAGREPVNHWTNALKALGFKFDQWNVNAPTSGLGNTPGGSAAGDPYDWPATGLSSLMQYSTIIWHAGALNQLTISPQDQALIQSWIQQTGKSRNFWIAGDNIAYDLTTNAREHNSFMGFTAGMRYLRNTWESLPQDSLRPLVTGTPGGPANGRSFHADGDCPLIDQFDLIANSTSAPVNGKAGLLLRYPNSLGAATRYATKYVSFGSDSARVVWMGFNFSGIEEGGERILFTKQVMQDYFKVPACYAATSVDSDPTLGAPPARDALAQNAPNPFNPTTTIRYSIGQAGPATIRVFDAGGRLVRTLIDAPHAPGDYSVRWDGKDDSGSRVGSGVYFYRIETGSGYRDAKKLILIK